MTTINSATTVYNFNQVLPIYNNSNIAPPNPLTNGFLAPMVDSVTPTNKDYSVGMLLAVYGANAPTPDLVGYYVNYDPASANLDQKVCVGVLTDTQNGMQLLDATANPNSTIMLALFQQGATLITGWFLNKAVLTAYNTPAVMTGFDATYGYAVIQTGLYADMANDVIQLTKLK